MGSVRKSLLQLRSTLRLPPARDGGAGHRAAIARSAAVAATPSRRPRAKVDGLQQLLAQTLWPMVETAFQDVEDQVEVRHFRLNDLQVVISRAAARDAAHREAGRRVTLELWPPAGPRILVVEWNGRRPYVVYRRDGDWLESIVTAPRRLK
jgi:hypothetical protein